MRNNLKSQTLIIIFIIATISILSPSHCENLIETTCKKTPHYDLCVQSLKSDPSSSDADVTGLALIMVKVITTQVRATSDKINQLLRSGHLDPKEEKALRSCAESFKIVIEVSIPTMKRALELGDPKFAEEDGIYIGNDARYCEEDFPGGTSPITSENNALRDLADVTVRLLL